MPITLDQHVAELRSLANTLMSYSFPKVKIEEDQEVITLRTRQLVVDGFDIAVTLCMSDYDKYQLESLQIQGIHTPFLPFSLVCKIARCFLGAQHLSYTDIVRDNRKIYCWTIRKRRGKVVPIKKLVSSTYEGFSYNVLKLGKSN
jgi:hypothetical protein